MKRSHFSQLPSVVEMEEILMKEAKREVPKEKIDKHFADFNPVIDWLEGVFIDAEIFRRKASWEEVLVETEAMKQELVDKTLMMKEEPVSVTKYLSEEDVPEKSDLIMLFGSNSKNRVKKAWSLWQKELADKIIISGGKPNYIEEDKKSEAEIFEDDLIDLGVPKEKIVVENKSITIPDNIRSSMNLLDKEEIKYNSIVLVLAWFAMRRAKVHFMKYGKVDLKIYRTSAEIVDENLKVKNWWKNEIGIKTIFDQFVKLKLAEILNTA